MSKSGQTNRTQSWCWNTQDLDTAVPQGLLSVCPHPKIMDFCTLGMLIIDEIHHAQGRPPAYDVLGGAGTFAVLGARIFRQPPLSANVGWVIHKGYDFPEEIRQQIESWETGVLWVETPQRQTTRALNEYGKGDTDEHRGR